MLPWIHKTLFSRYSVLIEQRVLVQRECWFFHAEIEVKTVFQKCWAPRTPTDFKHMESLGYNAVSPITVIAEGKLVRLGMLVSCLKKKHRTSYFFWHLYLIKDLSMFCAPNSNHHVKTLQMGAANVVWNQVWSTWTWHSEKSMHFKEKITLFTYGW